MVSYPSRIYPCWLPCEDGRSFSYVLDFTTDTAFVIDFQAAQSKQQLSMLRSMYIDNLANASPVEFYIPVSGQLFTIPANSCGYIPFMTPNPPLINATSVGAVKIIVEWLNMYLPPQLWGPHISFNTVIGATTITTESGTGNNITTENNDPLITET